MKPGQAGAAFMLFQILAAILPMATQVHSPNAFEGSRKKRRPTMKLNFVRPMILTAALFTLGAAANAQTGLVAKVPFSFRMNGTDFPAGNYRLATSGHTSNVIRIQDAHTGNGAMTIAQTSSPYEVGEPRLVFRCGDTTGCTLIGASDGGLRWTLPQSHGKAAEYERVAVVPLRRADAE
jgi:hypothetical protein